MKVWMKSVLFVAWAVALFTASFFGFASITGRSARDVDHERSTTNETTRDTGGGSAVAPVDAREHASTNASLVDAFLFPAPFSSDELARLQADLRARVSAVDARLLRIQERERGLDERERALESREAEFDRIAAGPGGLSRSSPAPSAAALESWKELGRFFEDGDPKVLARRLAVFSPAEAAVILRGLDDARAIEIVNALPPAEYKATLEAYRALPR